MERSDFPAVAPDERAIHRDNVVGERRREREAIVTLLNQNVAQEIAVLARKILGFVDARCSRKLLQRVQLRRRETPLVLVLECFPVERENVFAFLVVEAGLGLVAEAAALHEVVNPRCERQIFARSVAQPFGDMHEHVDAREIARAEGRGFGASNQRAGERVHFTDCEIVLHHRAACHDHAMHTESVGHKTRHILGNDNAFAKDAFLEVAHRVEHLRRRVGRRDDFEQVHVARGIEVVRAAELAAEFVGASFEQHGHGNARGVRRDDRVRRNLFDARKQILFRLWLLNNDFNNPVAVGE